MQSSEIRRLQRQHSIHDLRLGRTHLGHNIQVMMKSKHLHLVQSYKCTRAEMHIRSCMPNFGSSTAYYPLYFVVWDMDILYTMFYICMYIYVYIYIYATRNPRPQRLAIKCWKARVA